MKAHIYEIDGVKPVIHPSSFIHPTASIIGLVTIGKNCYIGPHASLRGDYGAIILEDGCNLQDSCTMHGFPHGETRICQNGHVSHGAVIHGCIVGENTMVGINAVIMDKVVIGKECLIGALSYVKPGFQVPDRSIVTGTPAQIKRRVTEKELQWKNEATGIYQHLTQRCLSTLKPCEPLTDNQQQHKNLKVKKFKPLSK